MGDRNGLLAEDQDRLRRELKLKALCGVECHAYAVSALLGAAAEILLMRFPREQAADLIIKSVRDAEILCGPPTGRA